MKTVFNISIVGTTCVDIISQPDMDKSVRLYGGITYVMTALSFLFKSSARISIVTKLERKYENEFLKFIGHYNNIDTKYIYNEPGKTNIVQLIYKPNKSEREEINNIKSTAVKFSQIKPVLVFSDILIISYISGYDIAMDTLSRIRREYKGIIYGDIHSYILKKPKTGVRGFRNIKNPERFLKNFNIIQGSELEWNILLKNRFEKINRMDYEKISRYVFSLGCKKIIITMGADGVFGAEKINNGKIKYYFIKANKVKNVIDTTGCGDSMLAGIVYGLMAKNNFYKGLKIGNKLGAIQSQRIGFFK